MAKATRSPAPDSDLRAEIQGLRSELEQLRSQLATEVRTRRLVVVDETGFERVTTTATATSADIRVQARPAPGAIESDVTYAMLYADEESGRSAGVYLSGAGNPVGVFSIWEEGELAGDDDDSYVVPGTSAYKVHLDLQRTAGDQGLEITRDGLKFHEANGWRVEALKAELAEIRGAVGTLSKSIDG